MITRSQVQSAQERAAQMLAQAGITITPEERRNIEVAEFGLGELEKTGLELVVYINTERYCAKELVLFPARPAPSIAIRRLQAALARWKPSAAAGDMYGYMWLEHPPLSSMATHRGKRSLLHRLPRDRALSRRTVHHLARYPALVPGRGEGAIVSEFSSPSHDESDFFTDPRIRRIPEII